MKPIFLDGYSSHRRMMLALVLSSVFIYCDHKLASFEVARGYLQSLVSPLQYIANSPKQLMDYASENIVSRKQLMAENQRFQQQELLLKEKLLQLDILTEENQRLRQLLASPVRSDYKKMVAEILAVDSDPYSHQVVINRGNNDGLFEGQPVIDENGVVGQILHVGVNTSRVLLLSDITHAIPLRVHRNGVRVIAKGTGSVTKMEVENIPHSTDIKQGDLLVTSGLGGKFPEGYPVAEVTYVSDNSNREFARITVKPLVELNRLRYLLLLWPNDEISVSADKKKVEVTNESQK
ncbi:MAG: rod shape-determining protein MreC [Thalassotalea sp.]|nr:rod shape-determining protein MreC [Thalassotalea sp.]MDG2394525.1 rod shape-determining protein MreC [Thalassotalea sp.]